MSVVQSTLISARTTLSDASDAWEVSSGVVSHYDLALEVTRPRRVAEATVKVTKGLKLTKAELAELTKRQAAAAA